MKTSLAALAFLLLTIVYGRSQGDFDASNASARTRIGSMDGPLAGPTIWGQMLAGPTLDTLLPVGMPLAHRDEGIFFGGIVTVPTVPCLDIAYVQFSAWDSTLWGTCLSGVPLDQLGRTDIVTLPLACFDSPRFRPDFTQPAIVPIPEPSVLTLGILGVSLVALRRLLRRRAPA